MTPAIQLATLPVIRHVIQPVIRPVIPHASAAAPTDDKVKNQFLRCAASLITAEYEKYASFFGICDALSIL